MAIEYLEPLHYICLRKTLGVMVYPNTNSLCPDKCEGSEGKSGLGFSPCCENAVLYCDSCEKLLKVDFATSCMLAGVVEPSDIPPCLRERYESYIKYEYDSDDELPA